MNDKPPPDPNGKHGPLLTEAQVCELLNCSARTLRRLKRDPKDHIPHMKVRGRCLYSVKEIEKWIARGHARQAREIRDYRRNWRDELAERRRVQVAPEPQGMSRREWEEAEFLEQPDECVKIGCWPDNGIDPEDPEANDNAYDNPAVWRCAIHTDDDDGWDDAA